MEIVRRVESRANRGHLFCFLLDEVSPDEPVAARVRQYFVVSSDSSCARAYCYLFICLSEIAVDDKLSRWLALYCRLFGVVTCDRFLKLLLSVAKTGADVYAFFTDERDARSALDAVAMSDSWPFGKGKQEDGGVLTGHLVHTPRGAETVDHPSPPQLAEELLWRGGGGCAGGRPQEAKEATPSTSSGVREMLEERLQESRLLLQAEKSNRERDVVTLRGEISRLEQQMRDLAQDHWSQLQHRMDEHQSTLLSLKREMVQKEAEIQRSHSALLEESEHRIHQLVQENRSLTQRHHEARIELERWRMECQELKHRLHTTLVTDMMPPINSVSREQYKDLERRHCLLHREFDELSAEKTEIEQMLQSTKQELRFRCMELESALRTLESIGKGLGTVQFQLPLVAGEVRIASAP